LTRTPGSVRGAARNGGPYRHTAQGGPYPRFRRALATGNPTIATAAAAELPRLSLGDALELVLLYRNADRRRFARAAVRYPVCARGVLDGARFCPAASVESSRTELSVTAS